MSAAYCKHCLDMVPCGCPNEDGEVVYGDMGREIARIIKELRDNGFTEAADFVEKS